MDSSLRRELYLGDPFSELKMLQLSHQQASTPIHLLKKQRD
jgi:hypothetical protein